MLYQHQYFKLDAQAKKVWDENGKELHLTDMSLKVLIFLCENEKVTVDELGDFLDNDSEGFPDYNKLRQHRYKINKIIGNEVVGYKNPYFFLEGTLVKAGKESSGKEGCSEIILANNQKLKLAGRQNILKYILILVGGSIVVVGFFVYIKNKSKQVVVEIPKTEFPKPQSEMVTIPAGDFLMGSTEKQALEAWKVNDGNYDKEGYLAEYPQQKINLPAFQIDKKEVSNDEYKMFIQATNRKELEAWKDQNLNAPSQPVVGVDWNEADAYCQWVGKKLPTEAQWEKTARGTDGRIWPWGNVWDPKKDNHGNGSEYGFDESDGFKYTVPVGTELGVSPFGVLNMAGNVYEWTQDDFNAYAGNDKFIQAEFGKGYKTIKGGAYTDGQSEQRSASRAGYAKDFRENDIGFRCAKDNL